jgi:hypothetical protein
LCIRDGFDCSKKIYNIARPKNNKTLTNVTGTLFPAPGTLILSTHQTLHHFCILLLLRCAHRMRSTGCLQQHAHSHASLHTYAGISSLLGAILPPVTVLLAIMAVIVSRLYTAYANAKAQRISNLNSTLAQASGLEPIQE